MAKQIVYVLVNEAMPSYIKIGKTDNLEARIRSLDNTSAPLPFTCIFAAQVENADFVEKQIHDAFGDHRVRSNREFFRLSPERAVAAIRIAPHKEVTPKKDFVESQEDQRALDRARTRRAGFNFGLVQIPIGSLLTFTRDPAITCSVVDNKRVNYKGEEMSVSMAADRALQSMGIIWKAVQGPLYWEYDGETLDERRTRLVEEEDAEIEAAGEAWMELQADIARGR